MIDYQTYLQIQTLKKEQKLKPSQIAETLNINIKTVRKWIKIPRYQMRKTVPRTSKLDPYKPKIQVLLDRHPYSIQQLLQLLREIGYNGSYSVVKKYVRLLRIENKGRSNYPWVLQRYRK